MQYKDSNSSCWNIVPVICMYVILRMVQQLQDESKISEKDSFHVEIIETTP